MTQIYVWLRAELPMMVEWRCVWMDCGVQCVVTHGTLGMPQLCADNLGMKDVSFSCENKLE